MLAALLPGDNGAVDVACAQRIKEPYIPTTLFRYRAFTHEAVELLKQDQVWMTHPACYANPFDNALSLSWHDFEAELAARSRLQTVALLSKAPWLLERDKAKLRAAEDPVETFSNIVSLRGKMSVEDWEQLRLRVDERVALDGAHVADTILPFLKDVPHLCAFSDKAESPALWARYGGAHRGFCVAYDFSELQPVHQRRLLAFPVLYSDTRFDVAGQILESCKHPGPFDKLVHVAACLHKPAHLHHEREWRIFETSGEGTTGFSSWIHVPKALYLGAKIEADHEQVLREVAFEKGLALYKMKPSHRSYALQALAIEPG